MTPAPRGAATSNLEVLSREANYLRWRQWRRAQYSKPLPPMNSRITDVGGTWSG